MPNTRVNKSAEKRVKTDAKKRLLNKSAKSRMRTAIKKLHKVETKEEADKLYISAQSELDKAVKKNLIHKNTAARKKSRLCAAAKKLSK
jgi:small subunit ribosomal protein S20